MTHEHLAPIPNLVILGAQKCGTSSLHSYLQAHRSVFMSTPLKEAGFYMPLQALQPFYEDCYGQRIDSKRELLEGHMLQGYRGEPIFGESPTHYTYDDTLRAHKLDQVFLDADEQMRFIYIVRNPFARIGSVYAHWLRDGRVQASFHDYMRGERFRKDLRTTCYHYQLQPLLKAFGREQVLVLQFEKLAAAPAAILARVYDFLGLQAGRKDFPKQYKAMNITAGALQQKVAYSETAYASIMEAVAAECEALRELLPDLDWDLSPARWVRDDADALDFGAAMGRTQPQRAEPSLLGRMRKGLGGLLRRG